MVSTAAAALLGRPASAVFDSGGLKVTPVGGR